MDCHARCLHLVTRPVVAVMRAVAGSRLYVSLGSAALKVVKLCYQMFWSGVVFILLPLLS